MIFLALIAAISNEITGGACRQFYFVDFCDAAGSANVGRLSVFAAHYLNLSLFFYDYDVGGVSASQLTSSKQATERESGKSLVVFVEVVFFWRFLPSRLPFLFLIALSLCTYIQARDVLVLLATFLLTESLAWT